MFAKSVVLVVFPVNVLELAASKYISYFMTLNFVGLVI